MATSIVVAAFAVCSEPAMGPTGKVRQGLIGLNSTKWIVSSQSDWRMTYVAAADVNHLNPDDKDRCVNSIVHTEDAIDAANLPGWARPYITHPQTGVQAYGWPMRCVRGCCYTNVDPPANAPHWDGLIPIDVFGQHLVVPWHPYAPGLVIDSALYAIAWAAALVGWTRLRRRRRLRRHRCPDCGYDLIGGLPEGCPECGWNRSATSVGAK